VHQVGDKPRFCLDCWPRRWRFHRPSKRRQIFISRHSERQEGVSESLVFTRCGFFAKFSAFLPVPSETNSRERITEENYVDTIKTVLRDFPINYHFVLKRRPLLRVILNWLLQQQTNSYFQYKIHILQGYTVFFLSKLEPNGPCRKEKFITILLFCEFVLWFQVLRGYGKPSYS